MTLKKSLAVLLFSTGVLLSGCTKDFPEINTNKNVPQKVDHPRLLLPAILKSSARDYFYSSNTRGNIIADYYSNQYVSGFDNAWAPSEVQGYFLWSYYDRLRDVENLITLSKEKQFKANQGIGLVMKVWLFQVMTDVYGDIPFSEAAKAKSEGLFAPKFDSQEDIYYGMLTMLEEANDLLSSGSDPIAGDVLMGNNGLRWRKFANGLQLRLLMRISGKTNLKIDVAKEMKDIVSDPGKYPLFTSHADQAAFSFLEEKGNEFPGFDDTPVNDKQLSTTLEKNLKMLNDPRINYLATPTAAGLRQGRVIYAGVPNGIGSEAENLYNGGRENQSLISPALLPLTSFPKASKTSAQAILLSYSEVQFILAEARERGLISTGNAETYYLNGVQSQFSYLGSRIPSTWDFPKVTDINPQADYYTQPAVSYTGSSADKLYKIRLQKWLSLFNNGFEGWSEWRRTGVPVEVKAGPNSSLPEMPRRARYPISEQRLNAANYQEALLKQGADELTTRVWWNKTN